MPHEDSDVSNHGQNNYFEQFLQGHNSNVANQRITGSSVFNCIPTMKGTVMQGELLCSLLFKFDWGSYYFSSSNPLSMDAKLCNYTLLWQMHVFGLCAIRILQMLISVTLFIGSHKAASMRITTNHSITFVMTNQYRNRTTWTHSWNNKRLHNVLRSVNTNYSTRTFVIVDMRSCGTFRTLLTWVIILCKYSEV